MDILQKSKDLEQTIRNFGEYVKLNFDRFSHESEEYGDLMRKLYDVYLTKLQKSIDKIINILKSPVAVGLVGRYSHGKTALLNNIFSIPKEFSLPEGEGIVTSKITRVDFDENLSFPKAFIIKRTGEKDEIPIKALQESVGPGSFDIGDSSTIDYFHLKLPANRDFSVLFARNNIALIDMPGIGGKYFKDTVLTRNYIEKTDFALVIIKITEIDKAGRAVNPILSGIKNLPLIPVFTFFDQANDSVVFSDCKDDEEIISKAKELAKEYIPSIAKWIDSRSIFVSNKDGTNIPHLREIILDFVEKRYYAIDKMRQETPELFKRKINEIRSGLVDLLSFLDKFVNDLEREIEKLKPGTDEKGLKLDLTDIGKSDMRKIKLTVKDIIRQYQNNIDNKILNLQMANNPSSFVQYLSDLESLIQNMSNQIEVAIQEEFRDIKSSMKLKIGDLIKRKINLPLERQEELRYEIMDVIDRYVLTSDATLEIKNANFAKEGIFTSVVKDKSAQIINSLTTPQFLYPVAISIALIVIGGMLKRIPFVGNTIMVLGVLGIIGSIASILFLTPTTKRFFEQQKSEKIRNVRKQVSDLFQNLTENILSDIESALEELRSDIANTIMEFTGTAYSDYKRNIAVINDIKNEKEKLRKEIELFSESIGVELI